MSQSEVRAQTLPEAEAPTSAAEAEEKVLTASQWQLMWWKFRRHKMAMFGGAFVFLMYLCAAFCEFLAPYPLDMRDSKHVTAPPQLLRWRDDEGNFHLRPFVYGLKEHVDPISWRRTFTEDPAQIYPVYLFARTHPYKFWGLFETKVHLFGVKGEEATIFLLGSDSMGRDLFSRILYGGRISLSVGLLGVLLSLVIGAVLGGISGYYGGLIDNVMQRLIEVLRSIPHIPLWMALSAALPPGLPPQQTYFGITLVLAVIGWTGLARVTRGKILSLRDEDFVMAAKICGTSETRIIVRHLLPSFFSYLIVSVTLSIPGMVMGETSLSFLGLGMRPPYTSWGVLLSEAQNIGNIAHRPWILIPGLFLIATVFAFNFLGDGLRDAADPYTR